jgi:uncharacterized protein YegJ (DUF2314 family)
MKPRFTWANVLIFLLGMVLIVGGFRRALLPVCALGSVLGAAAIGMAYRQRWAPWVALAGLVAVLGFTIPEMVLEGFNWRRAAGVVGICFLGWDIVRELRAAKRERDKPLISLVQFRRAPNNFLTDKKLADVAGRLWGDQMPKPASEEESWLVVGQNPSFIVKAPGMTLLVNNFPRRYFDDDDSPGDTINELRLRRALEMHTAWLSVDLLSMDNGKQLRTDAYPLLAKFFAELIDDDCLAIYTPETGRLLAYEPALAEKLRGPNPLEIFGEMNFAPVVQVADDDPRMKAAVAEARQRWPEFVAAFSARAGEHFAVKAPVTVDDNTEFIWIEVERIDGAIIHGKLANDPVALGDMKIEDPVTVSIDQLNDWNYLTKDEMKGGFTVQVLREASEESAKS